MHLSSIDQQKLFLHYKKSLIVSTDELVTSIAYQFNIPFYIILLYLGVER